jgi:hypothetical protein
MRIRIHKESIDDRAMGEKVKTDIRVLTQHQQKSEGGAPLVRKNKGRPTRPPTDALPPSDGERHWGDIKKEGPKFVKKSISA